MGLKFNPDGTAIGIEGGGPPAAAKPKPPFNEPRIEAAPQPAESAMAELTQPADAPKPKLRDIQLFNAVLRHAGDIRLEVPLKRISTREMQLLRAIHGDDCLVNIAEAGTESIDEREELYRLARKYPHSLGPAPSRLRIEKLLNADLHGYEQWLVRQMDDEYAENERKQTERNIAYNANRQREQAAALTDAIRAAASLPR